MVQYTTPTITLKVEDLNISTGYDVYATLEQGKTKLTKTGADLTLTTEIVQQITNTIITFELSQTESAKFNYARECRVQVNYINSSGKRGATEIDIIEVMENLLDRVIE